MLLPVGTTVLDYLYSVKSTDIKETIETLKPQYGGERQFTKERCLDHVISLEVSDLLNLESHKLDEAGELFLCYIINEDGKATVEKYMPKKYHQCSWREENI